MKFIFSILAAALVGSLVAIASRQFFNSQASKENSAPAASPATVATPAHAIPGMPGVPVHTQTPLTPPPPPPVYVGPSFTGSALPERPLWVEGTMIRGRKVWAYISDGRVFREYTKGLTQVDAQGVVIDGERIWMKRTTPLQDLLVNPSGPPGVVADKTPVQLAMMPGAVLNQQQPRKPAFNHADTPRGWSEDEDGVQHPPDVGQIGGGAR